jgi:aminotransferase
MSLTAARVARFQESVIREMTRLSDMHGAINMAQGFPDFDSPEALVAAAKRALDDGVNQYAVTWGDPELRAAIAEKILWYNGIAYDPERHITVTCGATEAMMAALQATVNPGDEVVVFEPMYENYGPDAIMAGATLRYVRLDLGAPGCPFDPGELAAAFGPRTKAIIVNTPHNPSGKVFTRAELEIIADQCIRHNALAITDEVYEHILYDGERHVSIAALPGMAARTITINSMSKTYAVTGWRVGWAAVQDDAIAGAVRRAHDFLTVCAAAPLQHAGIMALRLPPSYYDAIGPFYQAKRDRFLAALVDVGFKVIQPRGAYYVMADISAFGAENDVAFSQMLVERIGVATVPGSSFFHDPTDGRRYVRFAFPKRDETLVAAAGRLSGLAAACQDQAGTLR